LGKSRENRWAGVKNARNEIMLLPDSEAIFEFATHSTLQQFAAKS
jgi:hypothetical protein